MGDAIVAMIAIVVLSALAGKTMARKKGYSPLTGLILGGLLPLLGLGLITIVKNRKEG